jgi:hypothetical protein
VAGVNPNRAKNDPSHGLTFLMNPQKQKHVAAVLPFVLGSSLFSVE